MRIQVINFGINVSHKDFLAGATELAPNFASIPGLHLVEKSLKLHTQDIALE